MASLATKQRRTVKGLRPARIAILWMLIALLLLSGTFMYWQATKTKYRIPHDPVYLSIGPCDNEKEITRIEEFELIVSLTERRIVVYLNATFLGDARTHHLDIYLPFVVTRANGRTYTRHVDLIMEHHKDLVSQRSSLIRAIVHEREGLRVCVVELVIDIEDLVSMRSMGEEMVILTFGCPESAEFQSLSHYLADKQIEITQLVAIRVTIGVDKDLFLSTDTYLVPNISF